MAHTATRIASWTDQLATLQTKKKEHLSAISAIDSDMADLKMKIATATNASAPISSLPVETLAAIFELAVYVPLSDLHYTYHVPVVISHISSHWRDVALSRPSLWTVITVAFPNPSSWCQIYSTRSQQLPITLLVHVDGFESGSLFERFGLLRAINHRIHRFKLRGYQYSHLVSLFDYLNLVPLPILQYLKLEIEDFCGSEDIQTQSLFDRAPALHTLHLPFFIIIMCSVPVSTITHLSFCPPPYLTDFDQLSDSLQFFVSLTHLDMDGEHVWDWDIVSDADRLQLPVLTHLRLKSTEHPEGCLVGGFLNNLHAPSLTHLDLETEGANMAPFLDNNHSPNYRSVKTLIVSANAFKTLPMMVLLSQKFPAITSLDLGPMTGDALRNLFHAGADESDPIWDRLYTLTVRGQLIRVGRDDKYFNVHALQDIVSMRRHAGYPIFKICISGDIMKQLTANPDIWDTIRAQGCNVEQATDLKLEDPFSLETWPH